MFFRNNKLTYDKEHQIPVIRCSICTGEQVIGFKDADTGRFKEIMVIKNEKDLREFKKLYDIDDTTEIIKEY